MQLLAFGPLHSAQVGSQLAHSEPAFAYSRLGQAATHVVPDLNGAPAEQVTQSLELPPEQVAHTLLQDTQCSDGSAYVPSGHTERQDLPYCAGWLLETSHERQSALLSPSQESQVAAQTVQLTPLVRYEPGAHTYSQVPSPASCTPPALHAVQSLAVPLVHALHVVSQATQWLSALAYLPEGQAATHAPPSE